MDGEGIDGGGEVFGVHLSEVLCTGVVSVVGEGRVTCMLLDYISFYFMTRFTPQPQ